MICKSKLFFASRGLFPCYTQIFANRLCFTNLNPGRGSDFSHRKGEVVKIRVSEIEARGGGKFHPSGGRRIYGGTGGTLLPGGWNLRRSDFDNSNIFQN